MPINAINGMALSASLNYKVANKKTKSSEKILSAYWINRAAGLQISEKDSISDTTQFNNKDIFKVTDTAVVSSSGIPYSYSDIPFSNISLADGSRNLIFGNASTSNFSIKITIPK